VIFTILGGGAPLLMERYRARGGDLDLGSHPQVVVDTASFGQAALGQFVRMHGSGQLVHGSDAPVLAPGSASTPCGRWVTTSFAPPRSACRAGS
jgi:hypothetical protein